MVTRSPRPGRRRRRASRHRRPWAPPSDSLASGGEYAGPGPGSLPEKGTAPGHRPPLARLAIRRHDPAGRAPLPPGAAGAFWAGWGPVASRPRGAPAAACYYGNRGGHARLTGVTWPGPFSPSHLLPYGPALLPAAILDVGSRWRHRPLKLRPAPPLGTWRGGAVTSPRLRPPEPGSASSLSRA